MMGRKSATQNGKSEKHEKRNSRVFLFFSESERRNDEKTTKFSTDVLDASWESFG